jgi:hypothetical protein
MCGREARSGSSRSGLVVVDEARRYLSYVFDLSFAARFASARSILKWYPCCPRSAKSWPPLMSFSGLPVANPYASGPKLLVVTRMPLIAPSFITVP